MPGPVRWIGLSEYRSRLVESLRSPLASRLPAACLRDGHGWHSARHRQLVRSGQPDAGDWQGGADLLPTRATDFRPDLELLGPGGSMVRGSAMILAEVEEVIDLVVG